MSHIKVRLKSRMEISMETVRIYINFSVGFSGEILLVNVQDEGDYSGGFIVAYLHDKYLLAYGYLSNCFYFNSTHLSLM